MLEIGAPSLAKLTTLHLGGTALAELVLEDYGDLEILPGRLRQLGGRPFILGGGSNLLFADGELPLVLIKSRIGQHIRIIERRDGQALVQAGAGVFLRDFLRFCHKNGLSGMEGMTGIPGTLGGIAAMNAGSFGCEVAAVIHSLKYYANGEIKIAHASELQPGYRKMSIQGAPENALITEIFFTLTMQDFNVIFERMNLNFFKKKSRQPLSSWSAGCAFKNPPGESAGRLLERAGFRGRRLGGMAFSEKHANFLINEGNGTSAAALDLLAEAKEAARAQAGIDLEYEIRIIDRDF